MDAVLSGKSGMAFLIDDDQGYSSVHIDTPDEIVPRQEEDFHFLFRQQPDLQFLEQVSKEEVIHQLQIATDSEDAFQLVLDLLNPQLPQENRIETAAVLHDLFTVPAVYRNAQTLLFACPIPKEADLDEAINCSLDAELTKKFLLELKDSQSAIRAVAIAWEMIPDHYFESHDFRRTIRAEFIRKGFFLDLSLVKDTSAIGLFRLNCLSYANQNTFSNFRQIIETWVQPFQDQFSSTSRSLNFINDEEEQTSSYQKKKFKGRKSYDHSLIKINVERQQNYIIELLQTRKKHDAKLVVEELIRYQSEFGGERFIAKTLCNLAKQAKDLGMIDLQLEWARTSTEICPDDAWSLIQYADALKVNNHLKSALETYEKAFPLAKDYENRIVAQTGRAEVLKAQGRLQEALEGYDSVIREHPEDVVAKNGRAEILKSQGRLQDALDGYDFVIREHPEDVIAKNGRADVLKSMGRLQDALDGYDSVIREHPEDVVAKNGRAEVLKSQGRLQDALNAYEEIIQNHPESVVAKNGLASVLLKMEKLEQALQQVDYLEPHTENEWIGFHIKCMIYLKQGNMDQAIDLLTIGKDRCPFPQSCEYFKTSLAVCELRRRNPEQAESLLITINLPILQFPKEVITLHLAGLKNDPFQTKQAYEKVEKNPVSVVQELYRRYIVNEPPQMDDETLCMEEIDLVFESLLAA